MSRITFSNGEQQADLRGSERAWMGGICSDLAASVLGSFGFNDTPASPHWTRRMLPHGCYVARDVGHAYERSFLTWLRVDGRGLRHPESGTEMDAFAVVLNTALVLGSDPVRLMARIHAQCEIHGFIPPESAAFVAGIIAQGRESGLYRSDMGWEAVADLLRASGSAGKAVVMSYSVTDSFPGWDSETDARKDWETELAALHPTLAIRADTWKDYHFRDGDTLLSLEPRTP